MARRPVVMRGSVDTLAASHQEVLTLEVTTAHYNAIISRRQGWEARAIFRDNNRGRGQSHDDKLATLGRQVILQSGRATSAAARRPPLHRLLLLDHLQLQVVDEHRRCMCKHTETLDRCPCAFEHGDKIKAEMHLSI